MDDEKRQQLKIKKGYAVCMTSFISSLKILRISPLTVLFSAIRTFLPVSLRRYVTTARRTLPRLLTSIESMFGDSIGRYALHLLFLTSFTNCETFFLTMT